MTLEQTLTAVREYHYKCRDKNLENHTSDGIEIDPHTLTWAEYWLTKMSDKEKTENIKEQKSEAKWIYGEDKTGVDGWHCSECDFFEPWFYEFTDDIDFIRFYRYCPSCGRKMTSYIGKPTQSGR